MYTHHTRIAHAPQIVDRVRGGLTALQRGMLGALVVMDVHARDVVAELAKERVQDVSDFAWQAQLRSYWEGSVSGWVCRCCASHWHALSL